MATPYKQPGYNDLTPYLIVGGADAAIRFYIEAFGATERFRLGGPDGRIGHAELQIGDSVVMLADEHPEIGAKSPSSYGGSPVSLHIYVADADSTVDKAVAAGATITRPLADQFYGDRVGIIRDPFGHIWSVATHVEEVCEEEIGKRAAAMAEKQS